MNLKAKTPFLGQFSYCVLTGVTGTMVLAMFASTFTELHRLGSLIPWMMAFTAAGTGYSLMDKTGSSLKYKHMTSSAAGIISAILTGIILTLLSYYFLGENIFTIGDFSLFFIIALVCCELGALLAIKYFNLTTNEVAEKKTSNSPPGG